MVSPSSPSISCSLPSTFEAEKSAQRCLSKSFLLGHGVSVQIIWKQVTESLGNCSGESQEAFCSGYSCASKKGQKLLTNVQQRTENDMVPLQAQAEHRQALHIRRCWFQWNYTCVKLQFWQVKLYISHLIILFSSPSKGKNVLFKQTPSLWNEAEKD